jgi:hypothetical protein
MPAPKGTKPPNAGKGRPKGSANKLTKSVKDAFEAVFQDLQTDPKQPHALKAWAEQQPTEFYKLAAKLIPTDIKAQVDHTLKAPELEIVAAALGLPPPKK